MAWAQAAEKYPTIKAEFESYVSSGKLPGVLATIGRASGLPDVIAVGTQGLGEKTPVNIDTLWRVYSMTKPITGMAAWFGGVLQAGELHGTVKPVIIVLVGLHIAAALYHHFIKKDGLLLRMKRAQD
jgi:cytochrome b561